METTGKIADKGVLGYMDSLERDKYASGKKEQPVYTKQPEISWRYLSVNANWISNV